MSETLKNREYATFGAGCFWGVEAIFSKQKGVISTRCGYMGGDLEAPTYMDVCTGSTGHAEVVQLVFDRDKTSFQDLLDIFFRLHDPTTPNQQGPNHGTQYRSSIFFHSEEQKEEAMSFIQKIESKNYFESKVITEVIPMQNFYDAEESHQKYYAKKYQDEAGPICHILRKSW